MSFLETNFTINGESNEDYGIYIVGKDNSTTNQQFGVTSKAVRDKIKYRDEPYSMGFEREIYNNLALSIVRQAINDWRDLCKMTEEEREKKQGQFNFDEIEQFFKNDCEGYLDDTDISADRIYKI